MKNLRRFKLIYFAITFFGLIGFWPSLVLAEDGVTAMRRRSGRSRSSRDRSRHWDLDAGRRPNASIGRANGMSQWLRASHWGIQIAASALLALGYVVQPAYSSVIRYDFSGSDFSYILLGGIALPPELSTLTSFRGSFLIDDAIPGAGPPSMTYQRFPGAALSIAVAYNTGFSVTAYSGYLSQSRISIPYDVVSAWYLGAFASVATDLKSTLRLVAVNFDLMDTDSGGQDLFLIQTRCLPHCLICKKLTELSGSRSYFWMPQAALTMCEGIHPNWPSPVLQ